MFDILHNWQNIEVRQDGVQDVIDNSGIDYNHRYAV